MSETYQQAIRRQWHGEDVAKVAKFVFVKADWQGMKRYDVMVGGTCIGQVEQTPHTSYRMAGNLVAQTYNMVEWAPVLKAGERYTGLTYRTRKEATANLAANFLRPQA